MYTKRSSFDLYIQTTRDFGARIRFEPTMRLCGDILVCLLSISFILFVDQCDAQTPLSKMSTQKLLSCFADASICGAGEWVIADALAKRDELPFLIGEYWRENNPEIRNGIEKVAYRKKSSVATRFMEKILATHMDDGEDLYYPINYLAKRCDPNALAQLATGRFRFEGSLQYQTSVELFGRCGYKPAIPYLVDTALQDASFNIVAAADDSLRRLFPGTPKQFEHLETMQKYYCNRAHLGGFKVSCKTAGTQSPE